MCTIGPINYAPPAIVRVALGLVLVCSAYLVSYWRLLGVQHPNSAVAQGESTLLAQKGGRDDPGTPNKSLLQVWTMDFSCYEPLHPSSSAPLVYSIVPAARYCYGGP